MLEKKSAVFGELGVHFVGSTVWSVISMLLGGAALPECVYLFVMC